MDHNALRSCHATMYKFVTSMVHCGLGMQQRAMHNATIQKTTFFELVVYSHFRKGCHSQKSILEPKVTLDIVIMSEVNFSLLLYGRCIIMNLHSFDKLLELLEPHSSLRFQYRLLTTL